MSENEELSAEDKILAALFGDYTGSDDFTPPDAWHRLIDISDDAQRVEALYAYFSVLAETEECRKILQDILKNTQKIEVVDAALQITIGTYNNKIAILSCSDAVAADMDIGSLPVSYQNIVRLCDGLKYSYSHQTDILFGSDASTAIQLDIYDSWNMLNTMNKEDITYSGDDVDKDITYAEVMVTMHGYLAAYDKPQISDSQSAISFITKDDQLTNIDEGYSIGGFIIRYMGKTVLGEKDPRITEFSKLLPW